MAEEISIEGPVEVVWGCRWLAPARGPDALDQSVHAQSPGDARHLAAGPVFEPRAEISVSHPADVELAKNDGLEQALVLTREQVEALVGPSVLLDACGDLVQGLGARAGVVYLGNEVEVTQGGCPNQVQEVGLEAVDGLAYWRELELLASVPLFLPPVVLEEGDVVRGRGQVPVDGLQFVLASEDDVRGILHLHDAPVIALPQLVSDRAVELGEPVQRFVQNLDAQLGQLLGLAPVGYLDKGVVEHWIWIAVSVTPCNANQILQKMTYRKSPILFHSKGV